MYLWFLGSLDICKASKLEVRVKSKYPEKAFHWDLILYCVCCTLTDYQITEESLYFIRHSVQSIWLNCGLTMKLFAYAQVHLLHNRTCRDECGNILKNNTFHQGDLHNKIETIEMVGLFCKVRFMQNALVGRAWLRFRSQEELQFFALASAF